MINRTTAIIIGIIGALLGVAGGVVYSIWPDAVWIYTTLMGLAAVHLIAFFIAHFEALKAFSHQRSTQFGANSVLMVVIFVAILSIINFIAAQHSVRVDLSESGAFTLSPQTITVLKEINQEIKISGFFAGDSPKARPAKDMFENYRHQTAKVKYEIIDPDKKPAVAKQYGVTQYDSVVLESGGQSATVTNLTEQELTSAIIRISRKSKKQFYFIEGHGEHSIDNAERGGYSEVKAALEKQGFGVQKLILLSAKTIPNDAAVVIIGGPENAYAPEEQALIADYLSRGGQLFVLLDPMSKSGLEPFFAQWGIQLENDLILDPSSGLGPAVPIIPPKSYLVHPVTENFDLATFYSMARSVAFNPAENAERIRFDSFLQTGPNSWATKRIADEISIDPALDQKGPIILGGAFSVRKPVEGKEQDGQDKGGGAAEKMRIVVIGDSDFATNGLVRSAGNGDLFQNIISWLADEGDLISIRPKEGPAGTLILKKEQQKMFFYSSVLILPIGTLLFGLFISRKRRRL